MRAALCKTFGGPEGVTVEEIDPPVPGPGEVLLDVRSCALNFFDTLAIRDKYQYKPTLPFSPGGEVCATVAAAGPGVTGVEAGARVIAYLGARFNGCREQTLADADSLIPVPDAVPDAVACGVIVTYGTAIHGLKDRGRLQPGQTLAVLGAAGGAGLAAVEIGKRLGARVIACASSPEKLALCREHGADETINYASEDLKQRLRDLTGGAGADVIYDCVGGDYAEPAFRSIAWEGRYLVIGFASGGIPRMPLNLALLKGADIAGVFWGEWAKRNPERQRANIAQVLDWCASGELKPHVHKVYPLEEIVEALKVLDTRRAKGKVVIAL
ncbi:MAG: NADPH:quinone oxidoreductase family protein [Methyloligellaceae bacterium]